MQARSKTSTTRRVLVTSAVVLGALFLATDEVDAQSCIAPAFQLPATPFAVGLGPHGIAVLDFNRDGAPDAVATDLPGITVGLGDGAGGFLPPVGIPVPGFVLPYGVAVADFNLDGNPDVAVSDLGGNTLQAVLGDGFGGILPLPAPVVVGVNPVALAAGDFNRDGIPDLASANQSGSVQIVLGLGNGTFLPTPAPQILPVPGTPQDIVAGDFNRDGFLDVAVADPGGVPAAILAFGDGLGGFGAFTRFALPLAPAALAAGDVDNDGDLDVVVGDVATPQLMTLLGDGLGNLVLRPIFPNPLPLATSVILADFDSDGLLDLGTTGLGSGMVAVGFGDGVGNFGPMVPFPVPEDPFGLAVGDFDKDGRPDIVGSGVPVAQVALLLNQFGIPCPNVSFASAGRFQQPGGDDPTGIVHGDWNADGVPDLATAGVNDLVVLQGDGILRFPTVASYPLPAAAEPRALVRADFNLDSLPDLAVNNSATNNLSVFLNVAGTFPARTDLAVGGAPRAVVAGDFNGDGTPDLVSADRSSQQLTFIPGNGDGTFGLGVPTPIGVAGLTEIAAADIDGDLTLDVAVTSDSGFINWYRGTGTGTFTLGQSFGPGSATVALTLADLNGDLLPDLAVVEPAVPSVLIFLNSGGMLSFFGSTGFGSIGDDPRSIDVGDTNANSHMDLVVTSFAFDAVSVLLGDSTGNFSMTAPIFGFNELQNAILLDADRNGRLDLAVLHRGGRGTVVVLPPHPTARFGPLKVGGYRHIHAADFDRKGEPDLVALDRDSTDVLYLPGLRDGTFGGPVRISGAVADPSTTASLDLDRDGKLDLVIADGSGPVVARALGDGAGGFGFPSGIAAGVASTPRRGLVVADFDRDGIDDLAKLDTGAPGSVSVLFGDGTGFFVTTFTLGVANDPTAIVILDFNRDGILDLAVSNSGSNNIQLLEGQGTRATAFVLRETLGTDLEPTGLVAEDFDRDGLTDLVVAQMSSDPGKIAYFRGLVAVAPPFFGPRDDYALSDPGVIRPDGVAAADVNGDGKLDLLVTCRGGALEEGYSLRVLAGTGDPTPGLGFGAADPWFIGQRQPSVIAVADFDLDGRPDFANAGESPITNQFAVVLNSNCQPRRLRVTRNVSSCNTPLTPFAAQPAIQVEDDGGNAIQCNDVGDPVSVGIIPGTGTGGAFLGGDNPLATTAGVADWATGFPLSIDLPGIKYRLDFTHPVAGRTFSRTLSLPPPLGVTGPDDYCAASSGFFSTDPGFDNYLWVIDPPGPAASFGSSLTIGAGALAAGPHNVQVDATVDACPAPTGGKPFTVHDDLSNVMASLSGSSNICTTCEQTTNGGEACPGVRGWMGRQPGHRHPDPLLKLCRQRNTPR